jgi:hypothetical protein
MTSRVVVCCILLAAHKKLWVKELSVGASANLVDWARVEINEDGARDVFSTCSLVEEGLVGTGLGDICGLGVGAAIGQKAMLEEIARNGLENQSKL